jgi:copper homeostasis protein
MTKDLTLEVCVDSLDSAVAAEKGGAHRVELCSDLPEGGITPSSGLISAVRRAISIELCVLIRPRGGDFCYSDEEMEIMRRDIDAVKQQGADGVALGILDLDGRIDVARMRELVDLAAPMKVTCHRAFDMSCDLFQSLDELRGIGAHCILTSGGKQTAAEGVETLKRIVQAVNGRIRIMAGSGIEAHNVAGIVERTGVREIHASLKSSIGSPMRFRKEEISMGSVKGMEYQRYVVQRDTVRELLQAAGNHEAALQDEGTKKL